MNDKQDSREEEYNNNLEKSKTINLDSRGAGWYVVYTVGREDSIKKAIQKRAKNMGAEEDIIDIHIPKKTVTKVSGGKRQEKEVANYQRYLFVNMVKTGVAHDTVRQTPGVMSIIDKPLSPAEVARLFGRKRITTKQTVTQEEGSDETKITEYKVDFQEGDSVRIEGGAFDGFTGTAASLDLEHGKVTVTISVFGRMTPVDLTLDQVFPVA